MMGRLAGVAARRPWWFIAGWLLVLGLAGYLATGLGSVIDETGGLEVATESGHADALIEEHFGDQAPASELLIVETTSASLDSPAARGTLADLAADLGEIQSVGSVVSPPDGGPGLVSEDGRVAVIAFTLVPGTDELDPIEPVVDMVSARDLAGYRLTLFGDASIGAEIDRLAEETLVRGEAIGLGIALLIMIGVFGALVAAGIPILLSLGAIVVAVALTTLAGRVFSVSSVVLNMLTMIGLAVGVDYGLFIVHRYREERRTGMPVAEAVARAGDSAGRAVFFSGITVVAALCGLLIVPEGTIRGVGIGAVCAVIGAVAVALTLLPAVLGLLGDRIEKGSLQSPRRGSGRLWDGITVRVMRRPLVSAVAAGGLLMAMAIPYASINLGSNFVDSLPDDSPVVHGAGLMRDHFGFGSTTTAVVVNADDVTAGTAANAIAELEEAAMTSGSYGQARLQASADGTVALLELPDLVDPSTDEGRRALTEMRGDLVPTAFAGVEARVSVTGAAAETADFVEVIESRFPIVVAVVLAISFVLLLIAFRSVVVPIKAIVMNLLSVGAAYGMLVLVFQKGVGARVFGFQTSDVIESWIPLFVFTVLFGLSMDYHIFLLSRIKERHDMHGDNEESVAYGLRSTGGLITGAALIMVAVFGGFASGDLAMLQQLGFGLAVAVILDATIVRSVLVPATMALLGERNWYLPHWLGWLPRIEIEGMHPRRPATVGIGTGGV
jgi:RND superfamily putative drug exporter